MGSANSINSTVKANDSFQNDSSLNSTSPNGELHCATGDLLGPLGLFVQGLLAFVAFCSLIVKRFCEPKPSRRPWRIWFYDTSKQALGAAVIHFANVFLADVFQGDPCTWYVVSFLLDSTIGLLVIYIGLKIAQLVVLKKGYDTLRFGEYGSPPQCNAWIGQCALYILVMIIEKILMTCLVQFNFWKEVRNFMMSPIKDPHLELIIVMFIVPLIVNAIIFWVVDNFLMRKGRGVTRSMSNGDSIRYHKAADKVKYYPRSGSAEADDSDSDVLLSLDEDQGANSSDRYHLLANSSAVS
ncbi:store-operated calcium entry regulator STIMATE-like [Lineus longissimus]|uniref:store-operated calcium entry regulator STIMATE-like n=1 Tax=Lineus longissimus TaxID=88925 RepID=UPI002B4FA200